MFFFQIPKLPESLISARHFELARRALVRTSRPGTFSAEDLAQYQAAWSQPGAMTGMINWYRALASRPALARIPDIQVPTLVLWGKRDAFLLPELAERSVSRCRDAELVWFHEATHWVQHEECSELNRRLLHFFGSR